jgi:molybdopterin molybdotransferase
MISYKSSKNILKKGVIKIKDEKIKSINSLNRVSSSNIYSTINYPTGDNAALMVLQLIQKIQKISKKNLIKNLRLLDQLQLE